MCDNSKIVRTYEAIGKTPNPFNSLQLACSEIYWSRHVIWHLFVRDFVAGFRQKVLGYLWIVLAPLMGIASFVFMQKTGILNPGHIEIPYPIYVFIGTTIWGLLITTITTVSNGLISNSDLVMRTNIPKISLAVTGLANIFYNLLVNIVVLLFILLVFKLPPSPLALFYPLVLFPVIMLGVGLGLFLAVIGAVARDIPGMFIAGFNLLMYLTPVVYTAQFENSWLKILVQWNPLTYLVNIPRNLFVVGTMENFIGFAYATLFSFFVLLLGVHVFYLIKDKVAERL